jgi:hippurate hydrolase
MADLVDGVAGIAPELKAWRRELHAHPETAFEEKRTADFAAAKLASFGIEVHRGLAGTGVVGVLKNGDGPMVGLRADMDALPIEEANDLPYRSIHHGRMHACGHDGHTTMLLGAARLLAQSRSFRGAVAFIFQPAEENEGGGRVMIEQGLFHKFPIESVYGLHNWPGLPAGQMAVCAGPLMAAFDIFELTIRGHGAHGAMPHMGIDPIVVAMQVVASWQTIASRNVEPVDAAVVSVTQIHAGDTWNVIPETVVLRGTTRSFKGETQALIERRMREIADGVCAAFGARNEFRYERRYPATVNTAAEAALAHRAAVRVVGEANIDTQPTPSMGAEDFSFMLRKKPGCYVWLGNGSAEGGRNLHSPRYDFNDEVLPIGVSYWVSLVETLLPGN